MIPGIYPFLEFVLFCDLFFSHHHDRFIVAGGSSVIVSSIASCHAKGDRSTSRIQMSHSASTSLLAKFKQNLLTSSVAVTHACCPLLPPKTINNGLLKIIVWPGNKSHKQSTKVHANIYDSIDIQSHPKVADDAGNRWERFTILVSFRVPRFVGMSLDGLFIFLNSAPLFVPASESLFICPLNHWIFMNLGSFFSNIWSYL